MLAGLIVCAFFVLLAIRCKKKKGAAGKQEAADVDENPVYGIYYTSEGATVDEGRSEVVDGNDYYATS